jgi:cytochrome c-type biogenesis protein CcmE
MRTIPADSNRFRAVVVLAVAALGLGVLGWSGIEESLVYYRTPSEVAREPPGADERIRLGGLVVPGSVVRSGDAGVRMRITDGVHQVRVVHTGGLPQIFEDGQGAVVEGFFGSDGRLHSDLLMVRHSNEYQPPDAASEQAGSRDTDP